MPLSPGFVLRTALATVLAAAACAPLSAETISGLTPLAADPNPLEIKPGLAVKYYFSMFRRVHEIEE